MKAPSPSVAHLPDSASVLAVCAHPDHETFGLGGVVKAFVSGGAKVSVLCFTRGEASTIGASVPDLAEIRRRELHAAAVELGVAHVELLDYADGQLSQVEISSLAEDVADMALTACADLLLVFDEGGISGHPDHQRATDAALAGAGDLPVLAWALPGRVADALNAEFGAGFLGRAPSEIDVTLRVDRGAQKRAIAHHATQSGENPVLWRCLALLGAEESLRWLRRPTPANTPPAPEVGQNRGAPDWGVPRPSGPAPFSVSLGVSGRSEQAARVLLL